MKISAEKEKFARILAGLMAAEKLDQKGAARRLGVSQPTIYRVLNRMVRPRRELREKLISYEAPLEGRSLSALLPVIAESPQFAELVRLIVSAGSEYTNMD